MSNNSSTIPKSLQDALKGRQIIPFVGAGVSRAVEKKDKDPHKTFDPLFPSWKELIEILAVALKDDGKSSEAALVKAYVNVNPPKYLDAMQHAFEQLSGSTWYKIFDEHLGVHKDKADESSLELAQLVWQLGSNLIITSNVDRVLKWTCPDQDKFRILDTQTVEYAQLLKEFPISRPTVWHLHGQIDHKERIIFTREQYEGFYDKNNHQAKLQTLLNFLTNRTFLFIGFSLDDPYFLKQLEFIHEIYKGGADSFYVLLPEWEKDNPRIPKYVRVIPFKDYGKPLLEIMGEIRDIAKGGDSGKGQVSPDESEPPILPKPNFNDNFSNIPFPSKGTEFVGREGKLQEIWNALNRGGRAAIGQAVSIKGIGGLGKTQLAVEYAHYYHNKTNKEVYWLTADQDLDNQLIQIALKKKWLSETDKDFDQEEVARNRFRELSDCLIVFDNVETPESIKKYFPKDRETRHILITSREKQSGFQQIDLHVLRLHEAADLLLKIAGREPENEADERGFDKILIELDGLPLALELVGGYLKEHLSVSFSRYFEFLQKVPLDRLEAEFTEDNFTNHDKSIIRTLRISEKLLTAKPILNEILDVLAWSGTSSMGISLLLDLVGTRDDFALLTALSDAVNLRLIRKEDGERYAIHRLLARVRRHENPLENRKEWHLEKHKRLKEWFYKRKDDFNKLLKFEAEIEHLKEWQKQSAKIAENFQEALKLEQQALEMSRELFGEKHPYVATSLNNLGTTHKKLGNRLEAKECLNSAVLMNKELLGYNHPSTILTCCNLISVLSETGGLEKAIRLAREFLSYVPPNHPDRKFFELHAKTHSSASRNRKKRR